MYSKNKDSYLYYLLSTNTIEAVTCLMMHDILNAKLHTEASVLKKRRLYLITKYKNLSDNDKDVFNTIISKLSTALFASDSTTAHVVKEATSLKNQLDIFLYIPDKLLAPYVESNIHTQYYVQYEEITTIWYNYIKNVFTGLIPVFTYVPAINIWAKFFNIEKECKTLYNIHRIELLCNLLRTSSIENKKERVHNYKLQSNKLMKKFNKARSSVVQSSSEDFTPFSLRELLMYFKTDTTKFKCKELCFLLSGTECITTVGIVDILKINSNSNNKDSDNKAPTSNGNVFFKIIDEEIKAKINIKLDKINS